MSDGLGWLRSALLRLLGALGLVVVFSAFTPIPNRLAFRMAVPESRPASAIVVLGGAGMLPGGVLSASSLRRASHGIRLYRQGFAPVLVFSAGSWEEVRARAELARALGVPAQAILTSAGGRTTRDEAVRLRRLLHDACRAPILLVTDAVHIPRSRGHFEAVGFEVYPAPPEEEWSVVAPEERLALMRGIFAEVAARLYNRLAHRGRLTEDPCSNIQSSFPWSSA